MNYSIATAQAQLHVVYYCYSKQLVCLLGYLVHTDILMLYFKYHAAHLWKLCVCLLDLEEVPQTFNEEYNNVFIIDYI